MPFCYCPSEKIGSKFAESRAEKTHSIVQKLVKSVRKTQKIVQKRTKKHPKPPLFCNFAAQIIYFRTNVILWEFSICLQKAVENTSFDTFLSIRMDKKCKFYCL